MIEKFPPEEDIKYKRIFGGIALAGAKAPGFAVVIGETHELGFEGKPKYVFLDEVEDWDGRELIERVGWLDYRYKLDRWFGNTRDVALDKFVRELNGELDVRDAKAGRRNLRVTLSILLVGKEKDRPFTFIVPDLNKLLGGRERDKEKQRLFVKEGSKLMMYLQSPELGDTASMVFEDYPAVSALAFAVLELERPIHKQPRQEKTINDYQRI